MERRPKGIGYTKKSRQIHRIRKAQKAKATGYEKIVRNISIHEKLIPKSSGTWSVICHESGRWKRHPKSSGCVSKSSKAIGHMKKSPGICMTSANLYKTRRAAVVQNLSDTWISCPESVGHMECLAKPSTNSKKEAETRTHIQNFFG